MNKKIPPTPEPHTFTAALGLRALEKTVERETFIYLLRALYRLVFRSNYLEETKQQLKRRIERFEETSNLPGFLSAAPIDELLIELENAQYVYPIRRDETTLPTFH